MVVPLLDTFAVVRVESDSQRRTTPRIDLLADERHDHQTQADAHACQDAKFDRGEGSDDQSDPEVAEVSHESSLEPRPDVQQGDNPRMIQLQLDHNASA